MKKLDAISSKPGFQNLLYQLLETEIGGLEVYRAALDAVQNSDLKEEWKKYLLETEQHVKFAEDIVQVFGLDPTQETPARTVVRKIAVTLVRNIRDAIAAGDPDAAEIVAAEAVVEAETKDHLNWELLSQIAKQLSGEPARIVREALETVEPQEDHHLYHSKGWARELWIAAFGLPAALPPPEEVKNVETAIGAARAEKMRAKLARPQPKH